MLSHSGQANTTPETTFYSTKRGIFFLLLYFYFISFHSRRVYFAAPFFCSFLLPLALCFVFSSLSPCHQINICIPHPFLLLNSLLTHNLSAVYALNSTNKVWHIAYCYSDHQVDSLHSLSCVYLRRSKDAGQSIVMQ